MTGRIEVPLLDLRAQYANIRDEIDAAIASVVKTQHFILGPEVEALEQEIAGYIGSRFAVGCASGSDAVLLALMALGVGPGDQVLTSAYSFFATASAISRLGARPVFADIDPASFNLDPAAARKVASSCSRLRVIMPVHLFGQTADMAALEKLAQEHGVPLLEDAAQALGALDARGRALGGLGTLASFSFYPTKNLGGFGDGGMMTSDDAALAERLAMLRVHGAEQVYHHRVIGLNSRLDALQAAVLRVKLRHLDDWNERRRVHAAHYDAAFAAHDGLPLTPPRPAQAPARHVYHQYVIRVAPERRDALREHLAACGVGTAIYYPLGLHEQECFADLGYAPDDLPETRAAARETLALPIYPELTTRQLDHVVESIVSGLR